MFASKNEINQKQDGTDTQQKPVTECIVCYTNPPATLFNPCGHGGLCEECVRHYLKDKEECIYCKEKINEVYLLVEDKEKNSFKAKGVIKLKK